MNTRARYDQPAADAARIMRHFTEWVAAHGAPSATNRYPGIGHPLSLPMEATRGPVDAWAEAAADPETAALAAQLKAASCH